MKRDTGYGIHETGHGTRDCPGLFSSPVLLPCMSSSAGCCLVAG